MSNKTQNNSKTSQPKDLSPQKGEARRTSEGVNSIWQQLSKQKNMQLRKSQKYDMNFNLGLKGNLRSLSTSLLPKPKLLNYSRSTQNAIGSSRLLTPKAFVRTKEAFSFKQFNSKLEFLDELGLSHVRISQPDQNSEMTIEGRIPLSSSIKSITRLFANDGEQLMDLPFIKMKIKSLDDLKPKIMIARNKRIMNFLVVQFFDVIVTQGKAPNEMEQTMDGKIQLKFGLDQIKLFCNSKIEKSSQFIQFINLPEKPWMRPFGIETLCMNPIKLRIGLSNPPRLEMEGDVTLGEGPEALRANAEIILDDMNPNHALISFMCEEFTLYRLFTCLKVKGIGGTSKKILEASAVTRATFNVAPQSGVRIRGRSVPGGMEGDLDFRFAGLLGKGRIKVHKAHVTLDAMLTKLQVPGVIEFANKDILLDGPKLSMKMIPFIELKKEMNREMNPTSIYLPEIQLEGKVMVPDINRITFDAVGNLTEKGFFITANNVNLDKNGIFRSHVEISLGDFTGEGQGNEFKLTATISQEFEKFLQPTTEKLKELANQGLNPFMGEKKELKKKYQEMEDKRKEYEKMMVMQNHEMEGMDRKLNTNKYSQKMQLKDEREQEQLKVLDLLKKSKIRSIEVANTEKIQIMEESEKQIKEWKNLMEWGKEKSEKEFKSFSTDANKNIGKNQAELLKIKSIIKDRKQAPWYDDKKKKELTELYPDYVNTRAESMEFKEGVLEKLYYARLIHQENVQTLEKEYNRSVKEEKERMAKRVYDIDLNLKNELIAMEKEAKENIDVIFNRYKEEQKRLQEEFKENKEYIKILRKEKVLKKKEEVEQYEDKLKKEEEKYGGVYKKSSVPIKILENWKALKLFKITIETTLGAGKGITFHVQLIFLNRIEKEKEFDIQKTKSEQLYALNRELEDYQLVFEKFPTLQIFTDTLATNIYDKLMKEQENEMQASSTK